MKIIGWLTGIYEFRLWPNNWAIAVSWMGISGNLYYRYTETVTTTVRRYSA